tara:strand:+ start:107 stop:535 length:429 start_codon:yes stop_codon:yes gene_type:complete
MGFLYDKQNETTYFKWGFIAGACLAILGFIIGLIGGFFIPEEETATALFAILGLWLFTNLAVVIIYPFVLYFVLKKVDLIVPNMNKYSVAIYTLAGILITNTIISSIIAKSFVFGGVGLLPIIITFVVPVLYKIKNVQTSSQ